MVRAAIQDSIEAGTVRAERFRMTATARRKFEGAAELCHIITDTIGFSAEHAVHGVVVQDHNPASDPLRSIATACRFCAMSLPMAGMRGPNPEAPWKRPGAGQGSSKNVRTLRRDSQSSHAAGLSSKLLLGREGAAVWPSSVKAPSPESRGPAPHRPHQARRPPRGAAPTFCRTIRSRPRCLAP